MSSSPNHSPLYKSSPRLTATQSYQSPRLQSISLSVQSPSPRQAHRRKLSNVNPNQPPTHTITIAPRDTLSKAAQLIIALLHLRDIAYIDGEHLTVDNIDDSVQALIYLGKKLHSKSVSAALDTAAIDVSSQQSEYWINVSSNTISPDILQRANKQLNTQTYLVDRFLTVADVAFYVAVHTSILQFGKEERETYSNLVRWFNHIQSIPPIRDTNLLSFVHGLTPPSSIYTLGVIQPKPRTDKVAANGKTEHNNNNAKAAEKKTDTKSDKKTDNKSAAKTTTADKTTTAATASTTVQKAVANDIIYRLNLRVGKVLECKAHPTESKMLVSTVDFGSEQRTIVSGIAEYYKPEQLVHKYVINIHNVKAGDIKGVESQGRLFVATSSDGSKKEVVEPPSGTELGEPITFHSIDKAADATVSPKHLHEILKYFTTNADRVVQWKDLTFNTKLGFVTAPTIANGTVA